MISRKGFMRLAGLVGLGAFLPKGQRLPDTLLGLPIKWTSLPSPEITILPFHSGDVELAMAMSWERWQNLDLICSQCGAKAVFLQLGKSTWTFSKMLYECPRCGWQIELPVLSSQIPEGAGYD